MEDGERVLGNWSVDYIPPAGHRFRGQLCVTDRRVMFAAEVDRRQFEGAVIGPVDCEAVAYALDLDAPNVAYDGSHLLISIPASQIERVTADHSLLDNCASLTIKNNGSIQLFDKGLLPVTAVVRAIQKATGNAT